MWGKDEFLRFVVRFFIVSTITFIPWIWIGKFYMLLVANVSRIPLAIMGYWTEIITGGETGVGILCRGTFIGFADAHLVNFNIIPFIALVAASFVSKERKIWMLMVGLTLLFISHVVDLAAHFPAFLESSKPATVVVDSIGFVGASLPFLIWFAFSWQDVLGIKPLAEVKAKSKKHRVHECPICGIRKVGIIAHIKTVHGDNAIHEKEVLKFLEENPELRRMV